jgi:hypothetical protein
VLVDGVVVGTWGRKPRGKGLEIVLEPFEPLADGVLQALRGDAADVAGFLGFRPADVRTSVRT